MANDDIVKQIETLISQGWFIILQEQTDVMGKSVGGIKLTMSGKSGELKEGTGTTLEECLKDLHKPKNPKEVN